MIYICRMTVCLCVWLLWVIIKIGWWGGEGVRLSTISNADKRAKIHLYQRDAIKSERGVNTCYVHVCVWSNARLYLQTVNEFVFFFVFCRWHMNGYPDIQADQIHAHTARNNHNFTIIYSLLSLGNTDFCNRDSILLDFYYQLLWVWSDLLIVMKWTF